MLYKLAPFSESFKELMANYKRLIVPEVIENNNCIGITQSSEYIKLLKVLNVFTLLTSDCVIFGKITSLTAADIEQGNGRLNLNFGEFKYFNSI